MASTARSITGERDLTRVRGARKYGVVPPPSELRKYRGKGMTHQEIADLVAEETGHEVSRNAITMALARAGIEGGGRRYEDMVPWRVQARHARSYDLAMLRLAARVKRGLPISERNERRLELWKAKLEDAGLVVAYEPHSPDGFYYLDRRPEDGDGEWDLIRDPDE